MPAPAPPSSAPPAPVPAGLRLPGPGRPALADLPPLALPVTVVGDVHLSAREPAVQEAFLGFLRRLEGGGGTLVLLGDVFDWWVGRGQERDPAVAPVLEALARVATSGVALCFQPGNRDFAFRGGPGLPLAVWPDVVRTTLGGRRVLLTHGDLLVSGDTGYLRLRRVLRSRLVALGLAILPHAWLARVAGWLRRSSSRALARKDRRLLDIDYGLARRWLEAAGAEVLVAGHVHTGVHHRLRGPGALETLVLKDWSSTGPAGPGPAGTARGGTVRGGTVRGGVVRADGERLALVPVGEA